MTFLSHNSFMSERKKITEIPVQSCKNILTGFVIRKKIVNHIILYYYNIIFMVSIFRRAYLNIMCHNSILL